ncbi:hypothetical protein EYF80_041609 [Liparis tanakae]|uniref:Uncharacterized protein n=1 Tax=Liparis tanakae TaxID=230148 RepID=A0A4Z2G3N9_9TELE|nr:hypothetical protein EYF80_041609 [Liparis tanakae]
MFWATNRRFPLATGPLDVDARCGLDPDELALEGHGQQLGAVATARVKPSSILEPPLLGRRLPNAANRMSEFTKGEFCKHESTSPVRVNPPIDGNSN